MIECINEPAVLFRVGSTSRSDGLWYDRDGNWTGLIHTVPGAVAASLPMGPHPYFRADGRRWISTTDSLDMLLNWFSLDDMVVLYDRGYQLLNIRVHCYRRLHFDGYSHEVYCDEDVISKGVMDFSDFIVRNLAAQRKEAA